MAGSLDEQDLRRLRRAVGALREQDGRGVPLPELVQLAGDESAVTVDVAASAELGAPLVVLRPARREPPWLAALSPREREVAALLGEGLANKAIAGRLSISVATVKDHVHSILGKSGLPGRTAVAAALGRDER